jgi:hypothetical protein
MSPIAEAAYDAVTWPGEDAEADELFRCAGELGALRAGLAEPTWTPSGFTANAHDWTVIRTNLVTLQRLCEQKAQGWRARAQGAIPDALRHEAKADFFYRCLSRDWRY